MRRVDGDRMKFCLGTVQFGMNYGVQENGKPQQEQVERILDYAIEHGIDHFDTAPAYGEAQNILGNYFEKHKELKNAVNVISKLTTNAFDNVEKKKWKEIAVCEARKIIHSLRIDQLDAFIFHNAKYIFDKEAVAALNEVKREGLCKNIGVSLYSPEEALEALRYPEIGVIQIPYNVFDHRLDEVDFFTRAKERHICIYARSSLLQGLLMMDPERLPVKMEFAKQYLIKYREICQKYTIAKLDAAIGYVGYKQAIDYVVFGVDNLRQLQEYISISDNFLTEELVHDFQNVFRHVEERLVNPVLW